MLLNLIAIAVFLATTLLILCNLRMILRDTTEVVSKALGVGGSIRDLVPNVAFCALWALVFGLGFC